jgi:hypothetical protein
MSSSLCLYARLINHGQSQIWLVSDGTEITPRRTLASNEVRNIIKRLCPEAFDTFYKDWHAAPGRAATLEVINLADVAKELGLKSMN